MPVYLAGLFRSPVACRNRRPTVGLALAAMAGRCERLWAGIQGGSAEVCFGSRHRVLHLEGFVARACARVANPRREGFAVTATMSTCVEE